MAAIDANASKGVPSSSKLPNCLSDAREEAKIATAPAIPRTDTAAFTLPSTFNLSRRINAAVTSANKALTPLRPGPSLSASTNERPIREAVRIKTALAIVINVSALMLVCQADKVLRTDSSVSVMPSEMSPKPVTN